MSNSISFIGRLSKDPELRQVGQNDILELNLANNVGFGDRKSTNWFRCAIWGKRAVSLQEHLTKGQDVFITGQLTLREYTNRDGVKAISAEIKVGEIEFVGGKKEGNSPSAPQKKQASTETEEDMPF